MVDVKNDIPWGPIGKAVYERTYSRTKADGSKETWDETVERVVDGNLALVDKKFWKRNEREELIDLIRNFKALPAGRHLWVSGVEGRQFLFNCHVSGWREKLSDHYRFTFDELMKGGGVGSNYSNRFIRRYPAIKSKVNVHFVCSPEHADYNEREGRAGIKELLSTSYHHEWAGCIPVEDSREGWVDTLVRVIDAVFGKEELTLVFDVTRVRPYGTPIKGFGGTASGPDALIRMILGVMKLLNDRIGNKLSSLDHMLIDHMIAQCVVAGNVRRSARMSIKHWKDPDIFEFIKCKTDEARVAHWTTNISVEIDNAFFRAFKKKDKHAKKVYDTCITAMHESGEPGFWNSSLSQHGETVEVESTNPCVTIDTWIMTDEGPKIVGDLIGRKFNAVINGNIYPSTDRGFFLTGVKDTYLVTTDKGYSFRCTDNHQLPIISKISRDKKDIDWKELSSVSTGDIIALSEHQNFSWEGKGSWDLGWLIGSWVGDGTTFGRSAKLQYWGESASQMHRYASSLIKRTVGGRSDIGSGADKEIMSSTSRNLYKEIRALFIEDKEISGSLEKTSSDFHKGFLSGWFDADGSIQGNLEKGISVRLASSKVNNLYCAQRMLARLGIISKVYENRRGAGERLLPDGKGGTALYDCNADHELIISNDNIFRFKESVGFKEPVKQSKLIDLLSSYQRKPNRERFVDTIISIEKQSKTNVFDCQIPNINEFCGNGVRLHNCGEICLVPFENCNLGHVNLGEFYDSPEKAIKTFKLMTRFLIRATFGDIASPWQREVVSRNRRIGVGFFGFQDWLVKQGIKYSECYNEPSIRKMLRSFYDAVREEGIAYAHLLRIPAPIKFTTIAPTGTTAKLAGTAEGCQAIIAPYFEQRMRTQIGSETLKQAEAEGHDIEECINPEEGRNTRIIKYVCKHPLVDKVVALGIDEEVVEGQDDISVYDTLAVQSMLQEVWSDNAISLTVNLKNDTTKKELYHTLIKFLPRLKGTTVLVGVGDRPQPPYTQITAKEYNEYHGIKVSRQGIQDCKGNSCPIR